MRAARAFASLSGDTVVTDIHFAHIAAPTLRHRLRRDPLDEAGSTVRVERAIEEVLGPGLGLVVNAMKTAA